MPQGALKTEMLALFVVILGMSAVQLNTLVDECGAAIDGIYIGTCSSFATFALACAMPVYG